MENRTQIDKNSGRLFSDLMLDFFKNQSSDAIAVTDLCKEKAEAGDYNAMLWLARMYRDGKGVGKNELKAIEWYKRSKDSNVFSKFELLALLSNQKREIENPPEGLRIDIRKKERLYVYEFDHECIKLLVDLFPFTHYDVIGYSYRSEVQYGYNEYCEDFDKILVANVDNSIAIKNKLISKGIEADIIITVQRFVEDETFSGNAIMCDFSKKKAEKKTWVFVPNNHNGLMWFFNTIKKFEKIGKSEFDYVVDMQNHFSQVIQLDDVGLYNPWEYYFKQISPATIEKAYSVGGTIISEWGSNSNKKIYGDLKLEMSDSIKKKITLEIEKIGNMKKKLGLVYRGTEYVSLQPSNHGIPLDENELIEIVEERMKSLGLTGVYVNTEDCEAYEAFVEHFGDRAFAIDQRRFRKESKYNSALLDEKTSFPFSKLIQGERYLIATHLVTKCGLALICQGSGSDYVQRNSSDTVIEKHIKGHWGRFGNHPLIICSRNKNHISLCKATFDVTPLHCIDSEEQILIDDDREFVLNGIEIHLYSMTRYVCSFETKEPEAVSASLIISSKDGKDETIHLSHGGTFQAPFDTNFGTLMIKCNSKYSTKIGIQIEEGGMPTKYEPPRFSWTQICIKDANGKEYSPEETDYIDFDKHVFSVNGLEHKFAYEEVNRFHNIICFKGGFLTYHHGIIDIGFGPYPKTSIGPVIDQRNISGRPRQLRRFSHTCELAYKLLGGSQEDVEKALCIYHYHAMNYNNRAKIALSKIYNEGKYVNKDLEKAIYWIEAAIAENENQMLKNELIDMYVKRGTQQDLQEAYSIALERAQEKDPRACAQLARMYRDGKGVDTDLDEAIEWMRKAANIDSKFNNELIDMLWKRENVDDLIEMKEIAEKFAKTGDAGAMGRISRMYRYGKGVEKDLGKAIEWMRKAKDCNINWTNELRDTLWERGKSEDYDEAFKESLLLARQDNSWAVAHIALSYRYGKGVEKDLGKAIEWMQKASEMNNEWAKKELAAIIEEYKAVEKSY